MARSAIASVQDIEDFFKAYNHRNWETMFNYMSDDCVWDASEKRMDGRRNIIDYWTKFHAFFKETLGKPEHVVFGYRVVYLQVPVHLDFIEDGVFYGKAYKRGESLDFSCVDFYELDDEGKIKMGRVYIKFFNA
jgi:hypothetical protein